MKLEVVWDLINFKTETIIPSVYVRTSVLSFYKGFYQFNTLEKRVRLYAAWFYKGLDLER